MAMVFPKMEMIITLLGTGTSTGVPELGCSCEVCTSHDEHDQRTRTSALVEVNGLRLLIDCGPDFRQQMLKQVFAPIDGVLLTHEHYDHVGGLDDLRLFSEIRPVTLYGEERVLQKIRAHMGYCFGNASQARVPHFQAQTVEGGKPFVIDGGPERGRVEVMPFHVLHGQLPILAYRIGQMAYVTDMKQLPPESEQYLQNLDFMVVNALRHRPHPTHQTLDDAIRLVERLDVPQARLIHMDHSVGLHRASDALLPAHIRMGYDGEVIHLEES